MGRKFKKDNSEDIVKTFGDNMTEEKEPALSSEVSEKIRAAISAKLKELGAYVDDELPDYIMVLVANKKNQAEMKEDLQLFLNQRADVFTAWLGDILNKLKHVTKNTKPGMVKVKLNPDLENKPFFTPRAVLLKNPPKTLPKTTGDS